MKFLEASPNIYKLYSLKFSQLCFGLFLKITAVIDIQTFQILQEFHVKEMTIIADEFRTSYFFFKPNIQFQYLNHKEQKHLQYLDRYYNGLRFSQGYVHHNFKQNTT